jgi:hypothetical protein
MRAAHEARRRGVVQEAFKPFVFGNDGTFWMLVEDFVRQYNTLYVLRDLPEWQGQQLDGAWRNEGAPEEGGAAAVASFWAAVLTEMYLCNVCSGHFEILRRNGRGQVAWARRGCRRA